MDAEKIKKRVEAEIRTSVDTAREAQAISSYLSRVSQLVAQLRGERLQRMVELMWQAHQRDRMIFAFGNGGSCAAASHFVEDLVKGVTPPPGQRRFRALALTESAALITAWANDTSYENVFAEQLRNFVRPGDAVLAISASGNSANVLRALELANSEGAVTLGFGGGDGGEMKELVREIVIVPSHSVQQIEDAHLVLCHLTYLCLRHRAEGVGR